MNDARFDHTLRLLGNRSNRRQWLKSAAGGLVAAGLVNTPVLAQEPTATAEPLELEYPLLTDTERAMLMVLFAPTPSDWNVEHPERVVQTTSGIQFFDYPTALTFGALNEQQVAALPNRPVIGYQSRWQRPPRGGEPAEVGTTLDFTQLVFPTLGEGEIAPIWQTYQDTYFPGRELKGLGIDSIPSANYTTYDFTLADGRQGEVLAGVAQSGLFFNLINVTAWDGSKPSASALKRVLSAVDRRILGGFDEIQNLSPRVLRASPLFGPYVSSPPAETPREPVFVDVSYFAGLPVPRLMTNGVRETETVDDMLFEMRFTQPHPITGTEHVMPLSQTTRLFTSPTAADSWYRSWYELIPDHMPINPDFESEGRSFFEAQPLRPAGDGANYPIYHTTILDGPAVLDLVVGGGFPIPAEPSAEYRNALRDVGESGRDHFLAGLDGEDDNTAHWRRFEDTLRRAREVQEACADDAALCSAP